MYRVGTAVRDVTPPLHTRLQGHEARKGVSEKVHDPLFLKAMSLGDGKRRVFVVTSDLVEFRAELIDTVKKEVRRELGIEPEQVMITAAHVHTGPFVFADTPEEKVHLLPDYINGLRRKIIEVLREAVEREEPVTLHWGCSDVDIGVVNRRLMTPYGIEMRPNPAGPVDREVLVLGARNREGQLRAILFNYACHPTTIATDIYQISADFPGAAQRELQKRFPGAVALFVNGCCGDVRPNLVADGQFRGGSFEDVDRMGKSLADAAVEALTKGVSIASGAVEGRLEAVKLPLDQSLIPDTPEHLEKAAAFHLRRPKRDESVSGAWHTPSDEPAVIEWKAEMAARLARGEKMPANLSMDVQVLVVGDVRIVGLGGEIMVEIGKRIKDVQGVRALVGSCANGVLGYIPTAGALPEGGYEAKSFLYEKYPAPFDPSMENLLVERTRKLMSGGA